MSKSYDIEKLPRERQAIIDYFEVARKSHMVKGIFELDVTDIRRELKAYRRKTKESLSLSTYLIYLYAQAIDQTPGILKFRKGFGKVVTFYDVDISVLIERRKEGRINLVYYIIREANKKNPRQLQDEINQAQNDDNESVFAEKGSRSIGKLFVLLPGFLRRWAIAYVLNRNPFLRRKVLGTVSFSSLSSFGVSRGWGLSLSPHLINLVTGGLGRLPRFVEGKVQERDILSMTASVDHDFVDGAPGTRFMFLFQNMARKLIWLTEDEQE